MVLNHIHDWLTNSSCSHLIWVLLSMRSWQPLTVHHKEKKHFSIITKEGDSFIESLQFGLVWKNLQNWWIDELKSRLRSCWASLHDQYTYIIKPIGPIVYHTCQINTTTLTRKKEQMRRNVVTFVIVSYWKWDGIKGRVVLRNIVTL